MKFDAKEIAQAVNEIEREKQSWVKAAEKWEQMWCLQRYDNHRKAARDVDQVEQVVTSDPYNIVQLVTRFVANEMRVEIPYLSATDDDEDRSTKIEEWLTSFWQRAGRQQGRNLIEDMTWYSAVRGRGALQVVWVRDVLEEMGLENKRLPILVRTLDPIKAGVCRGPYWTEYAYHRYKAQAGYIRQMYPKFKLDDRKYSWQLQRQEYTVIDFYWIDNGSVWHAVTINDEFAKKPHKTQYAEVPIIEWYADGAPIDDELAKSLSILHPIKDLWELKCDLASAIGTGLLYYFDPIIKAIGFTQDIDIEPGAVIYLPNPGMDLDVVRGEPNVPMAEKMLNLVQTSIDQSTFPAVLYGEQPGGVQAGYAINSLAQQARNRVNTIRANLEGALEAANELILSIVEVMAEDEGIEVWGSSSLTERSRPIRLKASDIKGNYSNEVRLIPEIPTDESARIQIWLQMVREGIVSKATMRNRAINLPLPRDEEVRIAVERAMEQPELAQKNTLRAMQKRFKRDTLELLLLGTPLQQVYEQELQFLAQQAAEKEARKEAKRMEKEMERIQRLIEEGNLQVLPDGSVVPGSPMGEVMGGDPMTALTSGVGPMAPPTAPLPPNMPPGMGEQPGQQSMQPPGLIGVPPAAAGQLTPQMLGITPDSPAGAFTMATGGTPSDEEILDQFEPPMP